MSKKQAELLLAAVLMTRSTAYLFCKLALKTMGVFNLIALRFIIAFVLLAVVFNKRLRHLKLKTIVRGAVLGASFFALMSVQLTGLKTTPSATVSFLVNIAIILVPLVEAVAHRKLPKPVMALSAAIAAAGVGLMTLSDGAIRFTVGEVYCLVAAGLYTVFIILTAKISHEDDSFVLGILQVGFMGLYATVASFIFETPVLPSSPDIWASILVLALLCTGFGVTFQPVAQSHMSAERASIFCAVGPAYVTLLGVLFLHETFTIQEGIGGLMILFSLFAPHIIKSGRAQKQNV